jgi:hypothetical protein
MILLVGMMSPNNSFLYVCFHPLAYLVKLHIEMSMSDLIGKTIKPSRYHTDCRRSEISAQTSAESTQGCMVVRRRHLPRQAAMRRRVERRKNAAAPNTLDAIQAPKGTLKARGFGVHDLHLLPVGFSRHCGAGNSDDPELGMHTSPATSNSMPCG